MDKEVDKEKEKLEKIISRLKEKERPVAPAPAGKVAELKARLEGQSKELPLDFSKVSSETFTAKGLALVGRVYSSLQGVILRIAEFLSSIPVTKNMKVDLAAAGIDLSVEAYLVAVSSIALLSSLLIMLLLITLGVAIADISLAALAPLIGLFVFIGLSLLALLYPSMRATNRAFKIDRELPFALRHLATQLKSGVSFHRALQSIAEADYGLLSMEIKKVLRDIDGGMNTEEAFMKLAYSTRSKGLKKTIMQMNRALRTGGNLSDIMSGIASDVSFETRMLIRDFTEKLNIINVVFIMVAVVAPVTITILSAIIQLPIFAGKIPMSIVYISFLLVFAAMGLILFIIRRIEPA
ncbi:type II secretion system F family protein [Candidatus Micrarchaeota archaeon]|nr:type II secretion system F family protein [Candidatus Micrarchaeota archaeon]